MPYQTNQVQTVIDKLTQAQLLHAKIQAVQAANKVLIDDNDDMAIIDNAAVLDYIQSKKAKRDNLVASIQPTVAAWVP